MRIRFPQQAFTLLIVYLTSRVITMMTTQTVTALELTAERPEMVRAIIELIMADTIATLVEDDESDYSHLHDLFIRSGEDIVQNYKSATDSLFLFDEYRQLLPLVDQLIDNIGSDLFCDMLDTNESDALSEILRCFGHGVSFWDNHNYQDFGFSEIPKLKTSLTLDATYDVATQVLDKIAEANPNEDEETENSDFGIWLSENYEHSGGEYYLSKNPNDYLMYEWHILREQWEKDNNIDNSEDEEVEEDEPDNVYTFKIPECYLSLIFNDDSSELEDGEIQAWYSFCERLTERGLTNGHWSYPDDTESYFSYSNDVHNLGDNVVDLQWVDMS